MMETQKKYDVFISYSRKDFDEVSRMAEMLKKRIPTLDVWFDLDGIESGDEFRDKIISAIKRSKYVLFALSLHSDQSEWTRKELTFAKGKGIKIIPVLLQDTQLEKMDWFLFEFGGVDCIDLKDAKQVEKLVKNFSTWTNKPMRGEVKNEIRELKNEKNLEIKGDGKKKRSKWWVWVCMGICLALIGAGVVGHMYHQKLVQQEEYQQYLIDSLQTAKEEALRLDSINRVWQDSIQQTEARLAQERLQIEQKKEQARILAEEEQNKSSVQISKKKSPKTGMHNGHEYVDLGLSVKWATCNVGASKPEGYGDYFAWGETHAKVNYSWNAYSWCNGSEDAITKYDMNDQKTTLEIADDVANVTWGGAWRMPTSKEVIELLNNCTCRSTTQNGVFGYKITSCKSGYTNNSIFLPAAGYYKGSSLERVGRYGNYWSSTLVSSSVNSAGGIYFDSSDMMRGYDYRCYGLSVRPVCQ